MTVGQVWLLVVILPMVLIEIVAAVWIQKEMDKEEENNESSDSNRQV